MEFKVDFNALPKSRVRYYGGAVLLVGSLLLLIYSIKTFEIFYIVYSLFLSAMSFVHMYEGKGKSTTSLFGKRFLYIDEEKIEFKPQIFEESTVVYWDEIESVDFKTSKIIISTKNKQNVEIDYAKLSYEIVQRLKEVLRAIEKKKHLSEPSL